MACALLLWLLSGRLEPEPFHFVVQALTSYAALIVSFLGGMPWGLAMRLKPDTPDVVRLSSQTLWAGIAYSLAAWVAVLMPPHAGLVVLGVLLVLCYLSDRRLYPLLGASAWLTLRFRLSAMASFCCFLGAAQL